MSEYYIIDNWYDNPDEIREQSISLLNIRPELGKEKVKDSGLTAYPGYRARPPLKNLLLNIKKFEDVLGKKIDPKQWVYIQTVDMEKDEEIELNYNFETQQIGVVGTDIVLDHIHTCSNGSFQYCPEGSKTWVHVDKQSTYAAVIYLNPVVPPRCGTGLYKHKKTGKTTQRHDEEYPLDEILDFDHWEEIFYCENVYNRCFLYRSNQFHTATGYFGSTPEDSRLSQVFFFHVLDE